MWHILKNGTSWGQITLEKRAEVWVFFTFIDFSNVIEKCARLEAPGNAWLRFLPVRQNGARRHSPSFRPLRDVSGFKAAPPTLPSERAVGGTPEGWWSISLPFSTSFLTPPLPSSSSHSPLSPPQPEPAASGSSVDALHSVTRTKWRARVEKRDLYSVAAEWLGRVQSWGGDGGIGRKQAGGCGGKIMGSKVGQIERCEGYYLRQNDLGWRIDKKQRKGEGRLRRDGVPSCPGAERGKTEGWQEQLPSPLSGPPLRARRFDFNVNVRTRSPQARV